MFSSAQWPSGGYPPRRAPRTPAVPPLPPSTGPPPPIPSSYASSPAPYQTFPPPPGIARPPTTPSSTAFPGPPPPASMSNYTSPATAYQTFPPPPSAAMGRQPPGAVFASPVQHPPPSSQATKTPQQLLPVVSVAPPQFSTLSLPVTSAPPLQTMSPAFPSVLPPSRPIGVVPPQPIYQQQPQQISVNREQLLPQQLAGMSFGNDQAVDLLSERDIGRFGAEDVQFSLPNGIVGREVRCSTDIMRCTTMAFPKTNETIKKCRLPIGLTIQPFRDMKSLNVVNTSRIVRCRYCRAYINPYVQMPDRRHFKCNLCGRNNDLPDDFLWNPTTKEFDDAINRPEIRFATVEYVATDEYMLRKPQPPIYVFIFDISMTAVETGYLLSLSKNLDECLERLPGFDRAWVSFIGVDRFMHFFQFVDRNKPPRELVLEEMEEDASAPSHAGLLVNLQENVTPIRAFVQKLPTYFEKGTTPENCVGSAILAAQALIRNSGGRITVIQATMPTLGPGSLTNRLDPKRSETVCIECGISTFQEQHHLVAMSDFYKRIALECTAQQISVDLFLLSKGYADLATLGSLVSSSLYLFSADLPKFSAGSVYHFPALHITRNFREVRRFEKIFTRYLVRRIGFEAVLRIRCSKGLVLSGFYGNFFVRAVDLMNLPNVSPDSAVGVTVAIEESIYTPTVSFQAALLYSSPQGDRRIRVHTLCLPTTDDPQTIFNNFDIKAAVSIVAKLGVEKCLGGGSLSDAREAIVNASIDALSAWSSTVRGRKNNHSGPQLLALTGHLRLFPRYSLALLKHQAFLSTGRVRVDERAAAMLLLRNSPLEYILLELYPALYAVHNILELPKDEKGEATWPTPLPLTFERINREGVYVLDSGSNLYLYVAQTVSAQILRDLFGVTHFGHINDEKDLVELDTELNRRVHEFVNHISAQRFFLPPHVIVREDGPLREVFTRRLVDDRTESTHSYVEFLQHIRREINR